MNKKSTHPQTEIEQRGFALFLTLWLLAIGTLLGCSWYMNGLLASRTAENFYSRQTAMAMAHTGFSVAIALFSTEMEKDPERPLQTILNGTDGIRGPCFPSPDSDHNPVDPLLAWTAPLGTLTNACGDDGLVEGIGPNGISVFRHQGRMEYCLSGPCAVGIQIGHIWIRISDNPEPAQDPAAGPDSIVIMRIIAAAANRSDLPGPVDTSRNSISILEAWLQRGEEGIIHVLSIREMTAH